MRYAWSCIADLLMQPGPSFEVPTRISPRSKSLDVIRALRGSAAQILTSTQYINCCPGGGDDVAGLFETRNNESSGHFWLGARHSADKRSH